MSNYTETYRKPLMTDETGKAIANKLGNNNISLQDYNTSEYYRKPLMTDETAQEILAKIEGGSGGDSGTSVYEALFDGVDGAGWSNFSFTNDVTVKDVIDSIKDGKEVILKVQTTENSNDRIYLRYSIFNGSSNEYKFIYLSAGKSSNLLSSCYLSLAESDGANTGFRIHGDAVVSVLPDVNQYKNGEYLTVENGRYSLGFINQLPNVTSDDNGKTVQVVNGAWEKVNDTIKVTFTELPNGTNYICDMSIDNIIENYQAGKRIYAIVEDSVTFHENEILELINASNYALQDGSTGEFSKGVVFGKITSDEVYGMYYTNIIGKRNENSDSWTYNGMNWNNNS